MLALRRLWVVLVGAGSFAVLAGALRTVLGLEGTGVRIAVLAAAAVGGVLSLGEARRLRRSGPSERRDFALACAAALGVIAAVLCTLLPMPWGALGCLALLGLTAALVERREVGRSPR